MAKKITPDQTPENTKRAYRVDLKTKLKKGDSWRIFMEFDNDVALKIAEEKESSVNGAEYKKIINNRLRAAYKIKAKK